LVGEGQEQQFGQKKSLGPMPIGKLPWSAEIAIIRAHFFAEPVTSGGVAPFQRALPVSDGTIRQQES
jgi:hypothetical protein